MEPRILLETLVVAERLKDTTRHCYTRKGRHERGRALLDDDADGLLRAG